jgi:hypothetical protein
VHGELNQHRPIADTRVVSSFGSRRIDVVPPRARAAVQAALLGAGFAVVAALALSSSTAGDYSGRGQVAGDNAGPAISALIHGHLSGFVSQQPLMGLTSIVFRAPFVAAASWLRGGDLLQYQLGTAACLLPAVLLAAWMISRRAVAPLVRLAALFAGAMIVAGPATVDSIHLGHPEEVLASVLATGAVLAAIRGRSGWAAALLGLAIGTKQWALLAAVPVLVGTPGRRAATAVKAGGLALVLTATLPLADPAAFARANSAVGGMHFADPFSVWWPLGSRLPAPGGATVPAHLLPFGLTRSPASAIACLVGLGAVWACSATRRGERRGHDALALLALVGLLRCIADPDPLGYNFVALLVPLATWEVVSLERLPVLTALATGALAVLGAGSVALGAGTISQLGPAVVNALSVGLALALGCYLAYRAVRSEPLAGRWRASPGAVRAASAGVSAPWA